MDSYGAIAEQNKTVICYEIYFELQKLKEIIEEIQDKVFATVLTDDEIISK